MIIGEGPGANEDIEGKPFVGRAGKLLDKMLYAIQLDRTKVYISNVVNYRPPENRKPTEEEINRYLPYLKSHIEITKDAKKRGFNNFLVFSLMIISPGSAASHRRELVFT